MAANKDIDSGTEIVGLQHRLVNIVDDMEQHLELDIDRSIRYSIVVAVDLVESVDSMTLFWEVDIAMAAVVEEYHLATVWFPYQPSYPDSDSDSQGRVDLAVVVGTYLIVMNHCVCTSGFPKLRSYVSMFLMLGSPELLLIDRVDWRPTFGKVDLLFRYLLLNSMVFFLCPVAFPKETKY